MSNLRPKSVSTPDCDQPEGPGFPELYVTPL